MTEATERSISPLMMMKAIASATMIFSIESWNRLVWLITPRYAGDRAALIPTTAAKIASSSPSQPISRRQLRAKGLLLVHRHRLHVAWLGRHAVQRPEPPYPVKDQRIAGDGQQDQQAEQRIAP